MHEDRRNEHDGRRHCGHRLRSDPVAATPGADPAVWLVRVTDPAPGAGSDPEVVLVLVPPPGLGTYPCCRLWVAAVQVVDRAVVVDRLVTVVQEVPVTTAPKGAEWPAALAHLAIALDTGRVYDRDLPALAQALADVADALDRRPGWRLRPR